METIKSISITEMQIHLGNTIVVTATTTTNTTSVVVLTATEVKTNGLIGAIRNTLTLPNALPLAEIDAITNKLTTYL